jgi:hypothetical protein
MPAICCLLTVSRCFRWLFLAVIPPLQLPEKRGFPRRTPDSLAVIVGINSENSKGGGMRWRFSALHLFPVSGRGD